jgi:hypothetical protein
LSHTQTAQNRSIDLATPLNGSIDRLSPSWTSNLLDNYIKTIDAFSKYDNVLAYNVGNEVVVNNGTAVAPYVKAAARDTKAYLLVLLFFNINLERSGCASLTGSPNHQVLLLVMPPSTDHPTSVDPWLTIFLVAQKPLPLIYMG